MNSLPFFLFSSIARLSSLSYSPLPLSHPYHLVVPTHSCSCYLPPACPTPAPKRERRHYLITFSCWDFMNAAGCFDLVDCMGGPCVNQSLTWCDASAVLYQSLRGHSALTSPPLIFHALLTSEGENSSQDEPGKGSWKHA